jgi:CheY-like chemotaxis protein
VTRSPAAQVLIADDDASVREMLRTLLEVQGHIVLEARDGNEAWKLVQQRNPPVVVADVRMPGMSGLDLCRRLREDGHRGTKIIVWTAGMATEEEALLAGCDQFFLKSAPVQDLRRAIESYLSHV